MGKGEDPSRSPRPSDVHPEYIVLGFLLEGSTYGYDLRRRFEARLGGLWRISESQLYSMLKRLEARGLVAGREAEEGSGVSRRLLAVTQAGRAWFDEWLVSPTFCSPRVLRLEFLSRLYFAATLRPDLRDSIYRSQLAFVERETKALALKRASLPADEVYAALGLEFRMNQLEAARTWLEASVRPALTAS